MFLRFFSGFIAFLICFSASGQIMLDSTELSVDTVYTGLDIPWEIKWGPDDWIWTTERYGRVSRIDPQNGTQDILLDHSAMVHQEGESGMLGMEFHPDFDDDPYVFLVYTFGNSSAIYERLSRFEYDGSALINETILLDSIPGNNIHDGSRLLMLPDTTLLMTTGDAANTALSQNLNSLNGKVLRINTDGSVPADNPLPGSYVYSWGHRNAQGLMRHPNGMIYSSEHGPATDDEFQIIQPGRNYGWPDVKGFCDTPSEITYCNDSNVVEPLAAWTPTIAPSDIGYYDFSSLPEFEDAVLMSVLKDQMLVVLKLNAAGDQVINEEHYLHGEFGRLRDVLIGPDGTVYLATNGQSWTNPNPFTHSIIALNNSEAVAISENKINTLKIFPNPVSSELSGAIDFQGSLHFEIHDLKGSLLRSGEMEGPESEFRLNVSGLSEGIYLLTLKTGDIYYRQKFIKK